MQRSRRQYSKGMPAVGRNRASFYARLQQTAVGLAGMGATVVLACRNRVKGAAAAHEVRTRSESDEVQLVDLDLADLDSISACAKEILDNWSVVRHRFVKVMPVEYRRALKDIERAQELASVAAE